MTEGAINISRIDPPMLSRVLRVIGPAILAARIVHAAEVQFRSDNWFTECETTFQLSDRECSIIGVFGVTLPNGRKGAFSLLIDLKNRRVAVVGKPDPTKARIHVDKNPPLECTGTPYCIFSELDTDAVLRELKDGSVILIDVDTAKSSFQMSLSTAGYRAGLAKIQAQTLQ